jgi:hypothetical protein
MSIPRWMPLAAILVPFAAGCATTPAHVPISGAPSDVAQLAGDWSGEYWGAANGRSGVITFQLEAGADTAHGQVTMINRQAFRQADASSGALRSNPSGMTLEALTVKFVHAEGGGVTGHLDPYTDPACNCTAFTTFSGKVHGDAIDGTFVTTHGTGTPSVTGKWKVRRKKG